MDWGTVAGSLVGLLLTMNVVKADPGVLVSVAVASAVIATLLRWIEIAASRNRVGRRGMILLTIVLVVLEATVLRLVTKAWPASEVWGTAALMSVAYVVAKGYDGRVKAGRRKGARRRHSRPKGKGMAG